MAVRRLFPDQPPSFAFSPDNLAWAKETIAKYPPGKEASAVLPVLWRAQEQHEGWLPEPAIRYVADMLGMAYIRVLEVATFYTMFQLAPVGKRAHVQVCGTTPCMLRGAEDLIKVCKSKIHPEPHHVSADGNFSWEEVECLGSCANAPMVQVWKDTYEDLTPELFEKILEGFAKGNAPKPGSQIGRTASCPDGGPTTLKDPSLFDGSGIGAWQKRFAEAAQAGAGSATASAAPSPASTSGAAAPATSAASSAAAPSSPAATPAATPAASTSASSAAGNAGAAGSASSAAPVGLMSSTAAGTGGEDRNLARAAATAAVEAAKGKSAPSGGDMQTAAAAGGAGAVSGAAAGAAGGSQAAASATATAPSAGESVGRKPELLGAPRGGKGDDLTLIWGVAEKLQEKLNAMGIWHFDQIAKWSPDEVAWFEASMQGFKGRIERDKWIEQCKKLADGWRPDHAAGQRPKG